MYGLVFLIGLVGNLLVIIVVQRYKKMRNVTNVFLASLSTADLLLILFCAPIQAPLTTAFTSTLSSVAVCRFGVHEVPVLHVVHGGLPLLLRPLRPAAHPRLLRPHPHHHLHREVHSISGS